VNRDAEDLQIASGYEDQNDPDVLCTKPLPVYGRLPQPRAALTDRKGRSWIVEYLVSKEELTSDPRTRRPRRALSKSSRTGGEGIRA